MEENYLLWVEAPKYLECPDYSANISTFSSSSAGISKSGIAGQLVPLTFWSSLRHRTMPNMTPNRWIAGQLAWGIYRHKISPSAAGWNGWTDFLGWSRKIISHQLPKWRISTALKILVLNWGRISANEGEFTTISGR